MLKGLEKNKIINNFWSYHYITERLKTTAENYGIKLTLIDESNTSSYCPICGIRGKRMYRGLFHCKRCGRDMNADVVGALNIAKKCGVKIPSNIKLHPKSIKIKEILIQRKIIPMRDKWVQTHPSNPHIGLILYMDCKLDGLGSLLGLDTIVYSFNTLYTSIF